MNPIPTERSSHPSRPQIEALLDYLERNPSLAKGFSKVAGARDAARKHWVRLAVQLNSMGGSAKTWKQWSKYWADKKSAVKKKAALRAAAPRRTGGGVEEVVEISEVEERIIFLMGGEGFAIGDRHLAIAPFSEPLQNDQLLPSSTLAPPRLEEVTIDTTVNTIDTYSVPGTSYPSDRPSYVIPVVSTPEDVNSPPRSPQIVLGHAEVTTPSRRGVFPIPASPTPHPPPQHTSPRRPRRILASSSPPSQRRSQLTSITDRFLRMEERRLELEMRNSDILEAVTSAVASALNSIADALRLLADRR